MKFSAVVAASLLSLAAAQTVENPKDAAAINDNPVGVKYVAKFDGAKGVEGELTFVAGKGGKGVDITVTLTGFKNETGPFGYHIHDQPVPADGNCTGTKAHLDPYQRGQATPCDNKKPETCEVGDLAGKHGKIPAPSDAESIVTFNAEYNDLYASTKEGIGAFLGNRSIVIHRKDTTRLACANIVLAEENTTGTYPATPKPTGGASHGNGTNTTIPSASSPSNAFTGSATSYGVSGMLTVGALVAGLMAAL
ncbi:superoxide dismutase [Pyronema omphalodes]|nr:superoxide dismutase [Pyronema omphalodes]